MAIMILLFPPNDEIDNGTNELAQYDHDHPKPFGPTRLFTTNQIHQSHDDQDQLKQDQWDDKREQLEKSFEWGNYLFHPSILSLLFRGSPCFGFIKRERSIFNQRADEFSTY